MAVWVEEAWQQRLALQVDQPRRLAFGPGRHLLQRADRKDLAILHRQRLSFWSCIVHRDDIAAEVDGVSDTGWGADCGVAGGEGGKECETEDALYHQ